MAYKIVLSPKAEIEISDAFDYYSKFSKSAAKSFKKQLSDSYRKIRQNPFLEKKYYNVRVLPFSRYPYIILFRVDEIAKKVLCFLYSAPIKIRKNILKKSNNKSNTSKMAEILDGLKISKEIKAEIKVEVEKILAGKRRAPHLVAILVGNNGASKAYVNSKVKDCEEVGFQSSLIKFPSTVSESELLEKIEELNRDKSVDGFIVQLPLPDQIDQEKIINAIDPRKDVDGFHPENFGRMALEMDTFLPATPFGILTLLERYNIETKGKDCVIIGRSKIVGRPMSILMGRKDFPGNSTVTLTHSYTKDIEEYTKKADIVITALGDPHFLKGDMIKEGAVIVDVGITRVDNDSPKGYYLAGDVDFDSCAAKASWITPVPGGVGPMTRAMLMKNTIIAYKTSVYND